MTGMITTAMIAIDIVVIIAKVTEVVAMAMKAMTMRTASDGRKASIATAIVFSFFIQF